MYHVTRTFFKLQSQGRRSVKFSGGTNPNMPTKKSSFNQITAFLALQHRVVFMVCCKFADKLNIYCNFSDKPNVWEGKAPLAPLYRQFLRSCIFLVSCFGYEAISVMIDVVDNSFTCFQARFSCWITLFQNGFVYSKDSSFY